MPFGQAERLWYLGLALCVGACWFAANLIRSRPGRALQTLRDSEVAAAVMGVNVRDYKAKAFLVSSMYAGLAGVLYALSIGSVAPDSFGLTLSVQFLAMIVLGGLGSVAGSILGATFVSALPLVFQEYAGSLPFIVDPGESGHRGEPGGGLPVRRWRSSSSCSSSPAASPASRADCGAPHVHPAAASADAPGAERTRPPHRRKPNRQPEEQLMKMTHEARSGHARVGRHGAGRLGLQHQGARTRRRAPQGGVKVGRGVDGHHHPRSGR